MWRSWNRYRLLNLAQLVYHVDVPLAVSFLIFPLAEVAWSHRFARDIVLYHLNPQHRFPSVTRL